MNPENGGIALTPIEGFKLVGSAVPYLPYCLTTRRIYITPEFLVTFIPCVGRDCRIFIFAHCRENIDRQCMCSVTLWRVRRGKAIGPDYYTF